MAGIDYCQRQKRDQKFPRHQSYLDYNYLSYLQETATDAGGTNSPNMTSIFFMGDSPAGGHVGKG